MQRLRDHLVAAGRALREVAAEPEIRRLEIGWLLSIAGDWAFLVISLVVAYQLGGAAAVGIFGLVRMLPTIVAGPVAGTLVSRFHGETILLAVHLVRGIASGALALTLALDGPVETVLLAGAIVAAATSFVRPIHTALLPALVVNPRQLVAANVATSTFEGLGALLGPVIGGILVGAASPAGALGVVAALFLLGAAVTARIHVPGARRPEHVAALGFGATIRAGVRSIVDRPAAGIILASLSAQTFVRGLLTTLIVVASVELLGLGEPGIGGLNAAIGFGGLLGALAAVGLAGRRRLAPSYAVALAIWSLPIAAIAIWPDPAAAVALLFVVGIANAALDIAGFTLLQRVMPNESRATVFGLMEGMVGATVAIGAGVAPLLVEAFGVRGALAIAGSILPIVAVATWPRVSRADREAVVPEEAMELLGGVPILAPLSMTVIERLAGAMRPVAFPAGAALMRQGEPGETYLILSEGRAEVTVDGEIVTTLEPGAGVGEIALLRRVPRTATVTAVEPVRAQQLACADFVAAVSGSPISARVADSVIDELTERASPG